MSEDDLNRVYVPTWDEPMITTAMRVAEGDRLLVTDWQGHPDHYYEVHSRTISAGPHIYFAVTDDKGNLKTLTHKKGEQVSYLQRLE